jgi:hypothetical protein
LSLRTQTTVNVGENAGDKRNPYAVGGKIKVQPLWYAVWRFLKKFKIGHAHSTPLDMIQFQSTQHVFLS